MCAAHTISEKALRSLQVPKPRPLVLAKIMVFRSMKHRRNFTGRGKPVVMPSLKHLRSCGLGSNPGLRCEWPASYHLSGGKASISRSDIGGFVTSVYGTCLYSAACRAQLRTACRQMCSAERPTWERPGPSRRCFCIRKSAEEHNGYRWRSSVCLCVGGGVAKRPNPLLSSPPPPPPPLPWYRAQLVRCC